MKYYTSRIACFSDANEEIGAIVSDDDCKRTGKPIDFHFWGNEEVKITEEELRELADKLKELNQ